MAALSSRPSLRSSNRKNTIFNEVPPTHPDQNPLANSRRGKRTRDSSLRSQSNTSVKRLRLGLPDPIRSKDYSKINAAKSLPVRDRSATQDAVPQGGRSRKPDPLQRINGTTITSQNAQSFDTNATLTVNSTNASNHNDKRSLRSHDGCSRSKSELALYFPNYDELVSIEPKEPGRKSASIGGYKLLIHDTRVPYSGDPRLHHRRPRKSCIIHFNLHKCQQYPPEAFQWESCDGQWLFSSGCIVGRDIHYPE